MKILIVLIFLSFIPIWGSDNYLTSINFNSLEKENGKDFVVQKFYFSKTPTFSNYIKELFIEAIKASKYQNDTQNNNKLKEEAIAYLNEFKEVNVYTGFIPATYDKGNSYIFSDGTNVPKANQILIKNIATNKILDIQIHLKFASLKKELLDKFSSAYTYDEDFIKSIDPEGEFAKFKEKFKNENDSISTQFGTLLKTDFENTYNPKNIEQPNNNINSMLKNSNAFSVSYLKKILLCGYNEKTDNILFQMKKNKNKLMNLQEYTRKYKVQSGQPYPDIITEKAIEKIENDNEKFRNFLNFSLALSLNIENEEEKYIKDYENVLNDYSKFNDFFSKEEFEKLKKIKISKSFLLSVYISKLPNKGPRLRMVGILFCATGIVTGIASCVFPTPQGAIGAVGCCLIGVGCLALDYYGIDNWFKYDPIKEF